MRGGENERRGEGRAGTGGEKGWEWSEREGENRGWVLNLRKTTLPPVITWMVTGLGCFFHARARCMRTHACQAARLPSCFKLVGSNIT